MNIWAFHRGIVLKYFEEKEKEDKKRCKGTANSRVWSFLQIRFSVVGGCRIFWDSLSTIRKSKKEKPEKSWKLEINAKSSRYFFYSILSKRLLRGKRWEDK